MGKSSSITVGYRFSMGLQMGLCSGPVDAITQITVGGKVLYNTAITASSTISINQPNLFGGDQKEGGIAGTLYACMGEATQLPNPYLQQHLPAPVPAFRGLVTMVFNGEVGSMTPYVKPWGFRVQRFLAGWRTPVWQPTLCQVGSGMNGAHFVYRAVTDPVTGLGRDPSVLDDTRMTAAAQTMFNEGLSLCLKWSRSDVLSNFISMVANHVGGMFVDDPTTGMQYLKLLRGDYDINTLPVLDENNIVELTSYEQSALSGSVNEITVVYHDCNTDTDASVTVQNPVNILAQGRVVSQTNTYPGIWNGDLATRIAMRDLRASSSLPARMKLKVFSTQIVSKGDVRAFSWSKLNLSKLPIRVLEIERGTASANTITLTCAQDIYAMPDQAYVVVQPPLWTAPDLTPRAVPEQQLIESSYRELAANLSAGDLGAVDAAACYIGVLAARPTSVAYNYDLWTRPGTSGAFTKKGSGNFTPTALTATAMVAEAGPSVVSLTNPFDLNQVAVGSEAVIESEVLRVAAIDLIGNAVTLARGCVDTVPATHAVGARVWFTDHFTGSDKTEYLTGETVQAQLLTRTGTGTLDGSLAPISGVVLNQRQIRPYPGGNLTINGSRYPATASGALVLAWSHRDRLLSADQLVDTLHGNIGPETGTTYTVRVYLGGMLDSATSGITATTLTPTVSGGGTVRVEIDAVRGGLVSWQTLTATFGYSVAPLALSGDAPDGTLGAAYSYNYARTGGTAPYTWSISVGAVPPGLMLGSTGDLSGMPTATGSYSWTVRVVDALSISVDLPDSAVVSYATLSLSGTYPAGTVGTAYSADLPISGGSGTYSNSRTTVGSLPAGLALSIVGSDLRLSGMPTSTGTTSFTAAVDSSDAQTATSAQSVAINPVTNTYRYWRLLITANNGTSYTSICEVELRGSVGGADLTTPSAATTAASASDDQGSGFWVGSAQAAFDDVVHYGGTLATRAQWLSNTTVPSVGAPKWLEYDFGTPTFLAQVAITGSHDTDSNPSSTAIKTFSIQGSNDNSAWTTVLSPSDQTGWAPAEVRLFNL